MRSLKEMLDTMAYDTDDKQRFTKELGKRIQEERLKAGFSTGEFASRCGISDSCLFNTEKGRSNISITNLISICLMLDITLNDLIPEELYNPTCRTTDPSKE